jgi:hypothetical protein
MAPAANGNFNPDAELSNLTAVALFAKVLGLADKNDSAEAAMGKAVGSGLVPAGTDADDSMTRMDVAKMLITALGIEPVWVDAVSFGRVFSDSVALSNSDRAILNALYISGYIKGYDDATYRPDKILSRAEIAILVDRILSSTK